MEFSSLLDWITNDNPTLRNLASLGTVISLGVASFAYIRKQRQNDREEKQDVARASRNLYNELDDTLVSLDRKTYKEHAYSFKINNKKEIFFMNRHLNHDFYDSLVFSGRINFLRPELQQQVQNIFTRIKAHNVYLDLVVKMQDEAEGTDIPHKTYKYYEWMDKSEAELSKEIPDILKKLRRDFKL